VRAVDKLDERATRFEDLAPKVVRFGLVCGVIGLAASAGLIASSGLDRWFHSYLVAFAYFLSLSIGALFFVIMQHLVRAGWSVVVRRPAESLAMNLPWLALFFVPVLLGLRHLYSWTDPRVLATDDLVRGKTAFLNVPFFAVRWVIYFGIWSLAARYFWTRSVRQDQTGDVGLTRQREKYAAPFMVFFALSLNFAAFDLLMSLDPTWYSTIFGVYYFSGSLVGFYAFLSMITALLHRAGRLHGVVTDEHYHDLGKLVFGFTIFWAYIAFSQFMLIWYGNIPEETQWYQRRFDGQWLGVSWLLLLGQFALPFFYLLPRFVKRSPKLFGPMAAWVLIMHYVDLYWLVLPQSSPGRIPASLSDLAAVLAVGGFWLALAAQRLRRQPLVPVRDPRLAESMAFENA